MHLSRVIAAQVAERRAGNAAPTINVAGPQKYLVHLVIPLAMDGWFADPEVEARVPGLAVLPG